jgi:catechol 2,3-dioxygenase-like lactoylglutathione lyase family enzyme
MFDQCNVTIMVADMDRSVDFYTRGLQLTPGPRFGNEWAQVEGPGLTIGLHPRREGAAGAGTNAESLSIGFQVKDLDAAVAELRQRGVPIDEAAIRDGGVDRIVNFTDPDGTPLYLIQLTYG